MEAGDCGAAAERVVRTVSVNTLSNAIVTVVDGRGCYGDVGSVDEIRGNNPGMDGKPMLESCDRGKGAENRSGFMGAALFELASTSSG